MYEDALRVLFEAAYRRRGKQTAVPMTPNGSSSASSSPTICPRVAPTQRITPKSVRRSYKLMPIVVTMIPSDAIIETLATSTKAISVMRSASLNNACRRALLSTR